MVKINIPININENHLKDSRIIKLFKTTKHIFLTYYYKMDDYAFIYKCSFFESKRHTISHTDMYFNEEKHTRWVHCSRGHATVSVIRVLKNSEEYKSAINNSKRQNQLI